MVSEDAKITRFMTARRGLKGALERVFSFPSQTVVEYDTQLSTQLKFIRN